MERRMASRSTLKSIPSSEPPSAAFSHAACMARRMATQSNLKLTHSEQGGSRGTAAAAAAAAAANDVGCSAAPAAGCGADNVDGACCCC
ncbi:unnamed protein product [Closterium sp. NIES-54]